MGIRVHCRDGLLWIAFGRKRVLRVRDVRRSGAVVFSDRYASWHIGPFAVQLWFSRRPNGSGAVENARAKRFVDRWAKADPAP